jgi:hypothetical protein
MPCHSYPCVVFTFFSRGKFTTNPRISRMHAKTSAFVWIRGIHGKKGITQRGSGPQPNPKNTSQVRSPDFQSDFFLACSDWGGLHKREAVERNKGSD